MKYILSVTILILSFHPLFSQQTRYLSFEDGVQVWEDSASFPTRVVHDGGVLSCEIEYNFSGATISSVEVAGNSWDYLTVSGFQKMTRVGAPALPAHTDLIAMPEGATGRLILLEADYNEFPGFMIHPALMPANDTKGSPGPEFELDEAIYQADAFFPKNPVEITETLLCRGVPVAVAQIRPIQFNPVSGVIRVYSRISFRLEFTRGVKPFEAISASNSREFTNRLKRCVINSGSIPDGIPAVESTLQPGVNNYIIITHDNYLSAANDLANWKRQLGYTVEVVSQPGWTSAQVKSAIQTRYAGWTPHPDFVVLIGDNEDVPGETVNSRWYPYEPFQTDNYYACMDGTGDYVPDMARGRISVSSPAEANTAIQKMIAYEKNPVNDPGFYSSALHCAAFQDYDDYNGYADRRFCQTSEEVRDYMLTNTSYTIERIYQTNDAANPTNWNNGTYSAGEPIPPALLRSSGFPWKGGYHPGEADIISAINGGRFYVLHRDHGYVGGSGWADPYFTTSSSIPSLTNADRLPVIFSINCHTGEFQLPECFAEMLIRKGNGGAVGVIGAAHASPSGLNDAFAMGLFDAIWSTPGLTPNFTGSGGSSVPPTPHADIITMGDVLNHGLIRQVQTWNSGTSWNAFEHELMHYFGDPAMRIWTSDPNSQVIAATHPPTIDCAGTSFGVTNSTPNATATLVFNDVLISETVLDGSGNGTLPYSVTEPGPAVLLTISKRNHKPYISSLSLTGTCSFPPSVETQATTSVGQSSACAHGNIVSDFGSTVTESGVVFSPTPDPIIGAGGVSQVPTSPTVTSGTYSVNLTGLGSGTNYYLRAYATNANGTTYGQNDLFSTDPGAVNLPWSENWENATTSTYSNYQSPLGGLPEWEYNMSVPGGRLRFQAGSGFYHGGSKAATLDRDPSGTENINYLTATLDLSPYNGSSDLELSFFYMHHGEESHVNDRAWIRGSSSDAWVQIYDLYANRGTAGTWNTVSSLDIDAILAGASQSFTSTFQLRFGQQDNYPATSTTVSDGFTFDDIVITKLVPLANHTVQHVAVTENQSECYDATNVLTVAGSGSTVQIYSGGEAHFVAGSSIGFHEGFRAHPGSHVHGYITTSGNFCGNPSPPMVANPNSGKIIAAMPDMDPGSDPELHIFPNPTNGQFTLEISTREENNQTIIMIYSMMGKKIFEQLVTGNVNANFSLADEPGGIYLIALIHEDKVTIERLLKL